MTVSTQQSRTSSGDDEKVSDRSTSTQMQEKEKEREDKREETLLKAMVLGTLSSSCCWIQLSLGLFSNLISNLRRVMGYQDFGFGCAGFNTILGPLRPVTRGITLIWLLWKWVSCGCGGAGTDTGIRGENGEAAGVNSYEKKNEIISGTKESSSGSCCCNTQKSGSRSDTTKRKPILATILCLVLMFSPEMVNHDDHHVKQVGVVRFLCSHLYPYDFAAVDLDHADDSKLIRLDYVVDNMGCEACINAVERLLSKHEYIVKSTVLSLETGEVELYISKDFDKRWEVESDLGSESDSDPNPNVENMRNHFIREDLNSMLQKHGYELHERGWVTKKMKADRSSASSIGQNLFSMDRTGMGGQL